MIRVIVEYLLKVPYPITGPPLLHSDWFKQILDRPVFAEFLNKLEECALLDCPWGEVQVYIH